MNILSTGYKWAGRAELRRFLHRFLTYGPHTNTLSRQARTLGVKLSSPEGSGFAKFDGLRVRYLDPSIVYIEYKDIFLRKIYEFSAATDQPRILDCGSHIGLSILYAKLRHPRARVIGFEPDPQAFPMLERNLRDNGFDDVVLVNAALAATVGSRPFVSGADASHLASGEDQNTTLVPTVRLADYLNDPIDFLKMNIEGAELDVLRDCQPMLRAIDQMVIEYHGFESSPQYLHELLSLLHEEGFRYLLHDFDSQTNASTKPPFHLDESTRFFLLIYAKRWC